MNKLIAVIGVLLVVWLIVGYEQPDEYDWIPDDDGLYYYQDGGGVWSDPEPAYVWNPQPDITTYELAIILPYLFGGAPIESIEGDIRRHFVIEEK